MCSITTQKIMIDEIKHTNHKGRQHMTKYWSDSLIAQWSRQAVITVSRSTWMTTKIKMESPPIFSIRVGSVTRDTCS